MLTRHTPSPNPLYRSQEGYVKIMAFYDNLLNKWPAAFTSSTIPTRYGETHVIVSGPPDAPPLVLLHGGGINSGMWWPNIAALSKAYRITCIDIIGEAGKSAPTRLPRKGPEHVDWLRDVLDELDIASTHVAGVSLGGWLAIQAAAHAPERVRCLVAMSPVGFERLRLPFVLRGMAAAVFPSYGTISNLMRYIAPPRTADDPELINSMLLFFKDFKQNSQQTSTASDDLLRRISAPTLIIVGEHEVVSNPDRVIDRAHRLIPNVTTEIVAGAGHGVSSDQPEQVSALILRFLAAHS